MGLLGRLMGAAPTKKPTDDLLLLHSMMLMAGVDGVIEGSEGATLTAFVNTLPEFRKLDGNGFDRLMGDAQKLRAKFTSAKEAVGALREISSEAVRKKAFVLAADIAMSSGDIDEAEEELLEAMQRILGIDDALAQKSLEVLAIKYQT